MARWGARSAAPPEVTWALMARPGLWKLWAPHLRGAWGLGAPEVDPGRLGAARLLGVIPVPARVTHKRPGRTWTWRVGPVELDHRVEPVGHGSRVEVELRAPEPLESVLAATYGPVVASLLDRAARVAEGRS